ncbi:MAG: class I SAM-dependent methyltransferase [Candidatus Kapaibacterium sp.]
MTNNFWDLRYSDDIFAYGSEPNEYFKSKLDLLNPGTILLPGEGEGRNAVYASKNSWIVTAFDTSSVGREKAVRYANLNNSVIDYRVCAAADFVSDTQFDVLAFIFTHFGKTLNNTVYPYLASMVKPKGHIIFECFSIKQIDYTKVSGGPEDIDMLFTIGDIHQLFPDFEILDLAHRNKILNEGKYHNGKSHVINFFGYKK